MTGEGAALMSGRICVFEDIMAFCRSQTFRAMTPLPVQETGRYAA